MDAFHKAIGASVGAGGVTYRVWAPDHAQMAVVVGDGGRELVLEREPEGYWSGRDSAGRAGDRYRYRLADGALLPDAVSRFQPLGVHGPSECIDPSRYRWQCGAWRRPAWNGQAIYELHIGTFTPEGSYRAAISRLDGLRELGVEAIEIMPLADFAGDRNWGYDGVALYAPARCYGHPDDLRALVDASHARGVAVILDVVYNHVGPAGNYLPAFCADYLTKDQTTPWGSHFNLDGSRSAAVRAFLVGNAAYWLDEFRFDGLRLDATHAIHDSSARHILGEIAEAVHTRDGFVIAEDERNAARLLDSPDRGGCGLDALWSDDFHHHVRVALTGARHSYFAAYQGSAADVASTIEHGWSYCGQPFGPWKGRARGEPCGHLPPRAFVFCIENHDQVGNRARGERLEHLATPAQFRAASVLLCLVPYAPLIFMGQEWAASSPFLFFTDHGGELGRQVSAGRRREFQHGGPGQDAGDAPDPEAASTFEDSKLRWEERSRSPHEGVLSLYRESLNERRAWLRGAALDRKNWRVHRSGQFFAIRYALERGDRMLLATFSRATCPAAALPEVFRPAPGKAWRTILDSNAEKFGGPPGGARDATADFAGPLAVWLAAGEEGG